MDTSVLGGKKLNGPSNYETGQNSMNRQKAVCKARNIDDETDLILSSFYLK